MTEEDIRGLLREMREESLPADSLARVRRRLGERTASRLRWKIAGLVLAPVCVLVLALALRNPAPPSIELPAVPPVRVETAVMHSQPRHLVRRKQAERRATKPPVLIRIETPDPEVVILLVGN